MGALVDEGYRVQRVLGQGGMGVVVAARHVRSGELVAIKLIRQERASDPAFLKRFMREAGIALELRGPRVARVLRVGQLASGSPYLVMEYLDGVTLQALLRERGSLPTELAVDYLLQACDAVGEAHAAGVVHRDLKPGNLFLARGRDGEASIKVIDFGISKWSAGRGGIGEGHVTTTAAPIGSPGYMSPEQLSEVAIADPRSDVWALGIILFELVTGRHPFQADSVASVHVRILRDPAPSLRECDAAIPAGLDAVYARCVVKDRAARMPSVHDLVVALAPYASARGHEIARSILAKRPAAATTVVPEAAVNVVARRRRVPLALIGLALGAGGLAVLYAGLHQGGRKSTAVVSGVAVGVGSAVGVGLAASAPTLSTAPAPAPTSPEAEKPAVALVRTHLRAHPLAHRARVVAPRAIANAAGAEAKRVRVTTQTPTPPTAATATPTSPGAAVRDQDLFTTRR